jgi:hypothetical protein
MGNYEGTAVLNDTGDMQDANISIKTKSNWVKETTCAPGDSLVLSKTMLHSKPFIKLTGAAKQILIELRIRLKVDGCKVKKNARRGKNQFFAGNNGELVLTYSGLHNQFEYSTRTISKALDQLINYGFIEIAQLGCGVKRQSHKIALIENWRQYGTPGFKAGEGKADGPVGGGFKNRKPLQSKAGTPLQSKGVAGEKLPKVSQHLFNVKR